ncbi:MAG: SRPBCC family protein, partial [Saprospiraceae bacterium]|nr:SRPBCC family protein [Saprospiraceae bacterium]
QGMLIRYKVSPFAGIRMNWVTEITSVRQHSYFIDEQRFGPYALWHHEHRFENTPEGVLMTDNLHYALPLGILGQIANKIMVDKRIDHIFEFRQNIIKEIFRPKMPAMESTSK